VKILVVDDSRAMRGIVLRTLREAGYGRHTLLEAGGGAEALQLAQQHSPEVVIADWNMPGMNGLDLLGAVRARHPETKFGLVTSEAAKVRAQAMEAGARFVVAKPVTADALREALGALDTSSPVVVPCADAVSELLSRLLGRRASASSCYRAVLAGTKPVLIGVYQNAEGNDPRAMLAMDMDLAVRVGVAMNGEPATSVAPSLATGSFSATLLESLREFLSVAAGLLSRPGLSPVSLQSTHTQLRSLSPGAVALAVNPQAQAIFTVEIDGYGGGGLSVCVGAAP
jgi:two-component system chemotaxis response regulator CheY